MDSLAHARDSVHVADSIARADSLELLGKSSINVPAYTTARDSVIEVFTDGQRLIYYYGDVNVKYDDI